MKIFKKSFWALSTTFFGIMFAALLAGEQVTIPYEGQINNFLKCQTTEKVYDGDNSTPDTMYYKSPFIRDRWVLNSKTGIYEREVKKNSELARKNSRMWTKQVNQEGTVLLKNNEALPLKKNAKVSLFGVSSIKDNYITGGEGSGYLNANLPLSLLDELKQKEINVNEKLYQTYESVSLSGGYRHTSQSNPGVTSDINYVEYSVNEAPFSKVKSVADETISDYGDVAIYIISRLGSENGDTDFKAPGHLEQNYQDLTNEEIGTLDALMAYKQEGKLQKVVLLLNTCNPIQFKKLSKYNLDGILVTGNGGSSSLSAISDILVGKADPNGHLPDTYLYDNWSAPATANIGDFSWSEQKDLPGSNTYTHNSKYLVYQEGIYVGYKYYETRYEDLVMGKGNASGNFGVKNSSGSWKYNEEVAYPFGFGGSYASFEQSNFKVIEKEDSYICSVDVRNIGTEYSGKDVFQVYLQKPYTEYDKENHIEKSSVELVGIAKTSLLKPGQAETLNVTIDKKNLASYDAYNKKTYILEKGDYYFSAGSSSHDALNNILAEKGYNVSNGMDENGDSSKAKKITIAQDDFSSYSISKATNKPITNQFDDVDINLYEGTNDQKITYLSRNNWKDTYPTNGVKLKCVSNKMVYDMQYGHGIEGYEDPSAKMPSYNQANGMSLIDLLYEDYDSPLWEKLLDQMSYEEQSKITTWGANEFAGATSISAPGGKISDGPAGARNYPNANAYSSEILMASTFNLELVEKLGEAFGVELMDLGCTALYGPGANIHRTNFSGRNFEYFSEDGTLSGLMLNAEVKGFRSKGIITYTKHLVLNDQERNRYGVSVWANEQSIREIYLKAFEESIVEGNSIALMSSFNRLGCTWAGGYKGLMTNVLREEWGFKGSVITDAAVSDLQVSKDGFLKGILAGQDLWLTGRADNVYGDYKNEPVVALAIRKATKNNLYAQLHSNAMNGMKSGVRIVQITPWWKKVIKGAQIGVGIITGITLVMTVLSFVLPFIQKKKEVKE